MQQKKIEIVQYLTYREFSMTSIIRTEENKVTAEPYFHWFSCDSQICCFLFIILWLHDCVINLMFVCSSCLSNIEYSVRYIVYSRQYIVRVWCISWVMLFGCKRRRKLPICKICVTY